MADSTVSGVGGDAPISRDTLFEMVIAIFRSGALGVSGLLAMTLWWSVLLAVVGGVGPIVELGLQTVALALGFGSVALVFLLGRGYGRSYLDFRIPSRRDLLYVGGGILALLVLQMVLATILAQTGTGTADHSIEQSARQGNPQILLLLVPASWLFIGPGEELLYRNVIQKSLYGTFSERGAVAVASAVFALAHVPAYGVGLTLTGAATLLVIFCLSLVLGFIYLRTGNTTVPALVHGTFDAVIFGLMYVNIVYLT